MTDQQAGPYFAPSQEAGRRYFSQQSTGPVVMLNLLRFRAVADYSEAPELAPSMPISGAEAYERYMANTLPLLEEVGSDVMFLAQGGEYLIGPPDERWDVVMLVRHRSRTDFLSFASNEAYAKGLGHRLAAIEDSRLLPLVETVR